MFTEADHTFVIGAYKENPFLEKTIESLKAQTALGNIILSTSTPNDYLVDICKRHNIKMVVNEHPHLAGDDWNYGYNQAQTALVTIAHQDDFYEPDYVESFLNAINAYDTSEVSIVFSDYYEIRKDSVTSSNSLLGIKRIMNFPFRSKFFNKRPFIKKRVLAFGCSICCPTVMFNKNVAGESVFDTTYKNSCDYKTWVDLARRKGRFVYVPKQLLGHRIYEESATSLNIGEDIRKTEDQEILSTLWPRPIARLINSVYAKSEKSNELN